MAIHASRGLPRANLDIAYCEPFRSALAQAGNRRLADLPLGAIIAVAELVECLPITARPLAGRRTLALEEEGIVRDWRPGSPPLAHVGVGEEFGEYEAAFGDYTPGRYGWILTEVQALPEPIPCRGALALWQVPSDVEARIREQVPL